MDIIVSSRDQIFHRDSIPEWLKDEQFAPPQQSDSIINKNKDLQTSVIDKNENNAQVISSVSEKDSPCDTITESTIGSETDPNLLQAELDFLSTPSTEKYAEDAYQALLSVQDQCELDFLSLCSIPAVYKDPDDAVSSYIIMQSPISFSLSSMDGLLSLLGFSTFNSFTFSDFNLDANIEQGRRLLNLAAPRRFFSRQLDVVRDAVKLYRPSVMPGSVDMSTSRAHVMQGGESQTTGQKQTIGQTFENVVNSVVKTGHLRGVNSATSGSSSENTGSIAHPGMQAHVHPSLGAPKPNSHTPGHRQLLGVPKPRHGALTKQTNDRENTTSGGNTKTFRSQVVSGPQPLGTRSTRRLTSNSGPGSPDKHADREEHHETKKDKDYGGEHFKHHDHDHEDKDDHEKDGHDDKNSEREIYAEDSNRGLTQSQKRLNRRVTAQTLTTAAQTAVDQQSVKMLRSQLELAPLRGRLEGHRKTQDFSISDDDDVEQATDDLWLDDSTDDSNDDSTDDVTSESPITSGAFRTLKRGDDKNLGKGGDHKQPSLPVDGSQQMPRGALPPPPQDDWNQPKTEPSPNQPEAADSTYNYSLGFGSAGDQCLQQTLAKASVGCQTAVSNLYTLRSQYYSDSSVSTTMDSNQSEDSDYHHPHGPHGFFIFAFVILISILLLRRIYRGRHRKYRHQQINAVLSAVKNNPTLQAAVEAETGAPVPDLIPDYGRRCVRKLVFIVSLVTLVFTSVIVTAHILVAVSGHPNTEDLHPPHPVLAFCLWIVVFAVECAAAMALRKVFRCIHQSDHSEVPSTDYLPQPQSSVQAGGQSTRRRQRLLQSLGRAYEGLWGRTSTDQSQYAALVNTDIDSVELYHAPSAPPAPSVVFERKQQHTYEPPQFNAQQHQPLQQQNKILYVAAHPVGSINL